MFPFLTSTDNECGYTAIPTSVSHSSEPPFTMTDTTDGKVYSCATSTFYNYAVNTNAECAGASTPVSTVSSIYASYQSSISSVSVSESKSIASASKASVVSASKASASSAAAAVPSGDCKIWDAGLYYLLQVYGINDWAGGDGGKLEDQEDGCGALTGWEWHDDCYSDTQMAWFNLPFLIADGCVERAIASAGGPDGLTCHGEGSTLLGVNGQTECDPSEASDLELAAANVDNKAVTPAKTGKNAVPSGVPTHASVVGSTTHKLALPEKTGAR